MRSDALGLFWQDLPKIKKEKVEEKYLPPDEATWLSGDYLPFLEESLEFNVPLMTDDDLIKAWENKHEFFFDIESYINYYLIAFMDKVTEKVIYFETYKLGDQLYSWNDSLEKLKWILQNITVIGFNSIGFDWPLAVMAVNNKSIEQMKAATNMIIMEGYKPWQVLRKLKLKNIEADHIDIIEVTPLQGSLKVYGGRVGTRKMQDLPFHPESQLTAEQIAITRFYCVNDLQTTKDVCKEVEKDIQLRVELGKEVGLDLRSKSDAQIAEAVIAHELERVLGHKPARPNIEPGTAYRYRVPDWMSFQTPLMQGVLNTVCNSLFIVTEKGSIGLPPQLSNLKINLGYSVYTMGIGGLHSNEKKTAHYSNELYQLSDHDVTSYYPFIILNNSLFPAHLGRPFLEVFRTIVYRRIDAKRNAGKFSALAKQENNPELKAKAADFKRTADSLKIVINGTFGKLGSKWSLFYSPDLLIQTTLTGQLALLMLIEAFELNGIEVVSANTDGIVIKCPKRLFELRDQILEWWQQRTSFELEASFYSLLASKDVNNYLALKQDGGIKGKGLYSDFGMRKNPTNKVCIDAVKAYLEHGTPLEKTITECDNVLDFLTVRNVSGGAVAVRYIDLGEKNVSREQMESHVKKTGWIEYAGKWIKRAWINQRKPYERMVVSLTDAYGKSRWEPVEHEYLGKAIRWYYCTTPEGEHRRIIYAKNGNKVPKSEGCKPLMELDGNIPSDLDYDAYIREAESILTNVGLTK